MFKVLQRFFRKREIFVHEDDYCQQQLLPCEASAFIIDELTKLSAFSKEHCAPDSTGWTDVYIRPAAPAPLSALRITKHDFAALVSPWLPAFDAVYSGYSSYREHCLQTAAYENSGVMMSCWSVGCSACPPWHARVEYQQLRPYHCSAPDA
jgi:hypothetical protein